MKKFSIIVIIICLLSNVSIAQRYQQWKDIPEDIKKTKAYKRAKWFYNQRAYPWDTIPQQRYHTVMEKEIQKIRTNQDTRENFSFWTPLGPAGVQFTGLTSNWGTTSGRVRAIAVHPSDPLTVYIGAACGGIWKTIDGGNTWMDIGHDLESLSFGAIAIDPNNPEVIYAGSGEAIALIANFGDFVGRGLFKSNDGGQSWTQDTNGFGSNTHFGDIEVNPMNSNIVISTLASGSGYLNVSLPNEGIWKSNDGGNTWTRTLEVQDAFDIAFHPSVPDLVYAGVGGMNATSGFYISEDQGTTWQKYNEGLQDANTISRMQIDISRSNPDILYAAIYEPGVSFSDSKTRAYISIDGGHNWSQIGVNNELGGNYGYGWVDQGFYDLCIAIDPIDPDHVFIGNIELHETFDGDFFSPIRPYGSNAWKSIAHVDYHKLVFAPSNPDYLYIGCDGGLYRSTDNGATATNQNQGLETLQFYRISSHPENHDIILGGMQDNCNAMTLDGGLTWNQVTLGDGMESFFDYMDPDSVVYASTQTGLLYKSFNGGTSFNCIYNAQGAWTAPFFMHPTNNQWLYTANRHVLRSTDAGESFEILAYNVAPVVISDMAQSQINPDNMILATGFGDLPGANHEIIVKVSTDGGETWEDITNNIPGETRWISRVKTDPLDSNTMYVIRTGFSPGNKIWKTIDLGQTWINISGDLPDLPCNDLFIDPENTDHLYLANDIGVYLSMDGGSTWNYASEEIPFVPVFDFDYVNLGTDRYLRAGTHGRSIYEANLLQVGIEDPEFPFENVTMDIKIYPNPFSDKTTIQFELLQSEKVKVTLYNQLGMKIENIQSRDYQQGMHQYVWNASGLTNGIYFVQVRAGQEVATQKIVKMR